MAAANLVAYNAALKDTYTEDHLEEQILQADEALTMLETTRRFRVGNEARTPLHTSRNGAYTALGAGGGTLNTPGNQGSKRAVWTYKNHHMPIGIEGETIDGTGSDATAVAEVIDTEVSGALQDLRRQLVRQIFTNGDSIIATCAAGAADTTVLLEPVSGFNAIERGWLFEGAQVDIGTVANPVLKADGVTVVSVNESEAAPSFVASAAVTEAGTDQVSWNGSRTAAGGSFEMNGLQNIISTSTVLGGLDPAVVNQWKAASVDTNGGVLRPLTLPLIYKQQRKIKQKTGRNVDLVASSYKQEEAFYTLLQMQARFDGDAGLEAGNVEKASFRGMRVQGYADCKNEDMFFAQKSHLFIVAADKPYWQNKITGGEILEWIQNTDSYGSKVTYRINVATNRRNSLARLGDLS